MPERPLLDALLDLLDRATEAGWEQPTTLVHAAVDPRDADGFTLGFKEIDGHPVDHLLGLVAPPEWDVLGVICCGWSAPMDGVRPSLHEARRRIRQVFLVGRSGATASVVRFRDGGDPLTDVPTVGTVLDTLLRCFELPTAPPDEPTSTLFTAWWLNDVVGAARTSGGRLSWPRVAALHPGVRMLVDAGDRLAGDDVVRVGRAMANALDWPLLREMAIVGRLPGWVDSAVAAWMDDGMFSRWLLGGVAPVDVLLGAVADLVAPSTMRRVRRAVDDLGGPMSGPTAVA